MNKIKYFLLGAIASTMIACSTEDTTPENNDKETIKADHVVARFNDSDTEVYISSPESLEEGSLTFLNNGYHLNPVRSARVFTDDLGWVYMFDYGGGYLKKLAYKNGTYNLVRELDIAPVMGGNPHVRPWKINEQTILIHNINTADIEDEGNGITKKGTMYVTRVQIPEVVISEIMETWDVPVTDWDLNEKAYAFRVDAPTVMNDKIYYGVGRRDIENNSSEGLTGMHTIVLDYPSLENPKYIRSELGNGNTNGYRGLNMAEIDGYVYQANAVTNDSDHTVLVRLKDGAYDTEWVFDVSAAYGQPISTNKWYHVGNGIIYMSVEFGVDSDQWGLLRLDINAKSVEKLDVPNGDMFAYQTAIVRDGKFYMAITPTDTNITPKVYIIDVASSEVSEGLLLDEGNIRIEGLF
ncbi:hypothetical protein KMW28_00655 [Flammeovirga yaeyamensis]|uniref:Lipoprotein n=1 Tax=Flammeovirga yaeyamensis TaxID=367791 RepID=A0AAX1N3J3_9BACT|nr:MULTISPECIES: hypothetical protein [Flammeovirga]ANQ50451.1 hypothetical protein MY04_3083 [Flammeovirga sp. MY04]MBB3699591.1 hypothetical protein [Flammeovirga yaeyamensis]NMF36836.1 hypothetical protein [Flammeovirga yaeyamensis]QWG02125.1 hypothetical protein KMW28_00655 [Flammeovirga yaeyamensis]